MKVALFVHCFFPSHFYGTETYTFEIARNLQAIGHAPIVISAVFPGEARNPTVVSHYEYETIPVYCIDKNYFPNTRVKDTYYQPEIRDTLRDLLVEIKPDLIHVAHLINHTAVLLEVAFELGIPTVATFTDFFGFCFNNKLEAADGSLCTGPNRRRTNCLACLLKARAHDRSAGALDRIVGIHPLSRVSAVGLDGLRLIPGLTRGKLAGFVLDITRRPDILASAYSRYRAAIAPTQFLRRAYTQNGLQIPVHNIPFGVDLPRQPKPARNPQSPLKFGYIGQIAAHKGTDLLICAFSLLPKGLAELHVFGPEDQDPVFMSRLRRLAANKAIFFRGTFPREKTADVYSELDVLVLPSIWYENSPLALLNALATHTPVIVSNVEGMTEFMQEGRSGYIFQRGSIDDLERVFRKLVEDPELARRLSATTFYDRTTRSMTEDTLLVYDSVLASPSKLSSVVKNTAQSWM